MLKYVICGVSVGLAFVMYCCCRAVSEEDRFLDELCMRETERLRRERDEADRRD